MYNCVSNLSPQHASPRFELISFHLPVICSYNSVEIKILLRNFLISIPLKIPQVEQHTSHEIFLKMKSLQYNRTMYNIRPTAYRRDFLLYKFKLRVKVLYIFITFKQTKVNLQQKFI